MSKIKVLPPILVNQIAAGECIERPASIVKELVENSIDAESTAIEVAVLEAGTRLIRITDNGHGMEKDDLPLAITSHATSKLSSVDDLLMIQTLGFRGEALASVASVADVSISSRTASSANGYKIRSVGGEVRPISPIAINQGTIIEVHELFFNIPARRKFLKKNATEMAHITDTLTKLALSYHKASFKLTHNNKMVFQIAATETLKERIEQLLSVEDIIDVSYEKNSIEVEAYIAPPQINRSNSKQQHVYINGRAIKDRVVLRALGDAYSDYLPMKRHAVGVIFISINPQDVDVNVHPTKAEVRYRDSSSVYSAVYHATLEGLRHNDLTPSIPLFENTTSTDVSLQNIFGPSTLETKLPTKSNNHAEHSVVRETSPNTSFHDNLSCKPSVTTSRDTSIPSMPVDVPVFNEKNNFETRPQQNAKPQPSSQPPKNDLFKDEIQSEPLRFFQIHDSYIVIETPRGIEIIDQHALHERIIYSKLKEQVTQNKVQSQLLLFPVTVRLTATEMATFCKWQKHLEDVGLEMEVVREDVIIRAIPQLLSDIHAGHLLRDILEQLDNKNKIDIAEILDPIIEMMSCKAAIKAGDNLTPQEVMSLIRRRDDADNPFHCPHGRPTTLKITLKELEKHFKRT